MADACGPTFFLLRLPVSLYVDRLPTPVRVVCSGADVLFGFGYLFFRLPRPRRTDGFSFCRVWPLFFTPRFVWLVGGLPRGRVRIPDLLFSSCFSCRGSLFFRRSFFFFPLRAFRTCCGCSNTCYGPRERSPLGPLLPRGQHRPVFFFFSAPGRLSGLPFSWAVTFPCGIVWLGRLFCRLATVLSPPP